MNSRSELATFETVARNLQLPTDNLLLSGLPLLSGRYREAPVDTPIKTVMFADQPTVPRPATIGCTSISGCSHARAHPDRQVVLKPRHRLGEDTFHRMRFHPRSCSVAWRPPNFSIDYTPISDRLADLDLMLTVSSTAALEAWVQACAQRSLRIWMCANSWATTSSWLLACYAFDQLEMDDVGVPNKLDRGLLLRLPRRRARAANRRPGVGTLRARRPRPSAGLADGDLRLAARAVHLPQAGGAR